MKNFIVSYPRSGNSYVRYFLHKVTGGATVDFGDGYTARGRYLAFKSHNPIDFIHFRDQRLIILVRNYKEVIPRHWGKGLDTVDFVKMIREEPDTISHVAQYRKCIELYDQWTGPKLMVYYEDLIASTNCLKMIGDFLEIDRRFVDIYLRDYDLFFEQSRSEYGHSKTDGKVALVHSLRLDSATRLSWDAALKDLSIWKYVSRYAE